MRWFPFVNNVTRDVGMARRIGVENLKKDMLFMQK